MLRQLPIICCLMLAASCAADWARPDLVAEVASGKLKEARVSWWGFDVSDSTEYLQSAIDSGVPRLVVDKASSPWIARPLKGISNQHIVFEKGVEVVAKAGEFAGIRDSLFTFKNVTNATLSGYGATLRMRKADYVKPPYERSEARHLLRIISSCDITVEGLTLAESGGDGVYLSSYDRTTSQRIVLRDLDCVGNHRQGLSVICADGLLVERCRFRNTKGTLPESGIDFEPNHAYHRLAGVVVRDCVSEGNNGCGFEFSLGNFDAATAPVDILLENCRAMACNGHGISVTMRYAGRDGGTFPKGRIRVVDGIFEKNGYSGANVMRKPAGTVDLSFERCRFLDNCRNRSDEPTVRLANYSRENEPVDGIRFEGCRILHPNGGPWITEGTWDWTGVGVKEISGDVLLLGKDGGTTHLVLDDAWRRALMRLPDSPTLARVAFDSAKAEVVDACPGEAVKALPNLLRNRSRLVFHADGIRPARFVLKRHAVIKRRHTDGPLTVSALDGMEIAKFRFGVDDFARIEFEAPLAGFYSISVPIGRQCFSVEETEVPIAIDVTRAAQSMFRHKGGLLIAARAGDRFDFFAGGSGVEAVGVRVRDPDNVERFCEAAAMEPVRFRGEAVRQGLWTVRFEKPSAGVFDDFTVDLAGIPGFLFLSPQKYWTVRF